MLANPNAFEKGPEVLYLGHFWVPGGRRRRIERADQMECGEGEAELCARSPSVTLHIVLKSLNHGLLVVTFSFFLDA